MEQTTQQMTNSLYVHNLSTIVTNVRYRQPGNVIKHIQVVFTIWKTGIYIKAFALCSEEIQRILNLPDALSFKLEDGKPTAPKQSHEEIVRVIAEELNKINEAS